MNCSTFVDLPTAGNSTLALWPSFWCNMWLIISNYLHVAFKVFWIRQYQQMSLAGLQFLSPSKDARLINAPYMCCIDKNLRCLQEFLRNQTVQLPDSESVRGIDGGNALKKHRHVKSVRWSDDCWFVFYLSMYFWCTSVWWIGMLFARTNPCTLMYFVFCFLFYI